MAEGKNPIARKSAAPDAGIGTKTGANGAATPSGSSSVAASGDTKPEAGVKKPAGTVEPLAAGPEPVGGQPAKQLRINGFESIDPGILAGDGGDSDDSGKRKRGRPAGSGSGKLHWKQRQKLERERGDSEKAASDSLELKDLDSLIMIAHFTCARILEIPELELTQEESERLAEATRKVAKHYAVSLDPKRMALVELLFTAGGVYGPRVIGYVKRTGTAKRASPQSPPQVQPTAEPPGSGPAANGPPPIDMGRRNGPRVPSEVWQEEIVDGSFI